MVWQEVDRSDAVRAFDVIQPDPCICGGIGELVFIAELARLRGVACIPHTCNGAVALAATLQGLAVLPDSTYGRATQAPMLEYDWGENPIRTELLTEPIRFDRGWAVVPTAPGLGVTVDEHFVASRTVQHAESAR